MPSLNKTRERILGIDPGIERTGVGIIEIIGVGVTMIYVDCISTPKDLSQQRRLSLLQKQLTTVIKKFKPTRAAVEKLFFSQNVKTAMSVSEARGVILQTLEQAGLSITEWTPQQIKQNVTGYGGADKQQVQKLVCAILKLKKIPQPDDATDALAVALTAQHIH